MSYIKTTNNTYPHTESDIRASYPNTSFANPFVPPAGYAVVFPAPQPAYNPSTQRVQEGPPVQTAMGHWEQTWTVIALDAATIAANLAAAKAARKALFKATLENLINSTNTYTTVEGWVVDAKRTDLDNLKNYRDLLVSTSATTATVRMRDNTAVNMSVTRLQSLVSELIAAGLSLYQRKWTLEAQVDDPATATVAQVNAVVW